VKSDDTEVATGNRSSANDQTTWRFTDLPLAQVKDFRFQSAPRAMDRVSRRRPRAFCQRRAAGFDGGEGADEEAIRLARERVESARRRYEVGVASNLDVVAAERDLAIAEARGDATKIAESRVRFAKEQADVLREQHQIGIATEAELNAAESALNAARRELEEARPNTAPGPP
jgi:hypothetical protein